MSFLRNSQFDGPLYLITENASYYDDLMQERAAHPRSEVRFIPVDLSSDGGSMAHVALPVMPKDAVVRENTYGQIVWIQFSELKRHRLRIKWLKSKLFEVVPREYEYVVFMDSDIFIGQALQPVLDRAIAGVSRDSIVSLFRDVGHTGSPYHTGIVVFSRKNSQALVKKWGENIMLGTFGSDQRAIEDAVIQLDGASKVHFLPAERADGYFAFIDGKLFASPTLTPTFIHATSYRITHGKLYGFTNRTAKYYFEKRIQTPYEPWIGAEQAIVARYCDNILGWPTRTHASDAGNDNDERDIAQELQRLAEIEPVPEQEQQEEAELLL